MKIEWFDKKYCMLNENLYNHQLKYLTCIFAFNINTGTMSSLFLSVKHFSRYHVLLYHLNIKFCSYSDIRLLVYPCMFINGCIRVLFTWYLDFSRNQIYVHVYTKRMQLLKYMQTTSINWPLLCNHFLSNSVISIDK